MQTITPGNDLMTPIRSQLLPVELGNSEREVDVEELRFQKLKVMIHERLVDSLDLSMLAQIDQRELEGEVRTVAVEMCDEFAANLNVDKLERLINELVDEVFGLGPLEGLMHDPYISDILVNHPHEVYVERKGCLELSDVIFADEAHLVRIIQRIVSRVGRRVDAVSPMVDARLPDGSRVNAVLPPLTLDGPTLSIRRFGKERLQVDDLIENSSLTADMYEFLAGAVESRASIMISGGTGAGKTTLLNALAVNVPNDERLVTIEDSAELKLQHKHVVRMETRPANTEDTGEITQRALVRNSLRMRPDRIIVGEVRGPEALDMLQAMNTGHEGSLTTIHANDTRDALSRLELMVAMGGLELPMPVVRQYITSGIALIVHVARLKGGIRRVTRISEIVGIEDGVVAVEDIFRFEQSGVDAAGAAQGEFHATGYQPKCLERLRSTGIHLPDDLFEKRVMPHSD